MMANIEYCDRRVQVVRFDEMKKCKVQENIRLEDNKRMGTGRVSTLRD